MLSTALKSKLHLAELIYAALVKEANQNQERVSLNAEPVEELVSSR